MKAILLTAGYGSRLKPLTDILPKCLFPINGRPLVGYWLSMLKDAGLNSVLLNLHYLGDKMKEWIELSPYSSLVRLVNEDVLLGTGGTLYKNKDYINNDSVMLIHADNLCITDLSEFIEAHRFRPSGTEITMMTFQTPTPNTCGIVEIDNTGIVKQFYEKVENPPGNLANAAVYIIEPVVLNFLGSFNKAILDFSTEVLPKYVEMGKVFTYYNNRYHRDIGTLESYITSQIEFPQKMVFNESDRAWAKMCKKNSYELENEFLMTLKSAFKAECIFSDNQMVSNSFAGLDKESFYIFYCTDTSTQLERIFDFLKGEKLISNNILIFFRKVPIGFSSNDFFLQTGYKSIALYCDVSD